MQSSKILSKGSQASLSLKIGLGHVIQVRNHVKIYPWRASRVKRECYLDTTKTPYTDKNNLNEFSSRHRQKKPWMIVKPKDKDDRFNAFKWNDAYKSDPKEAKQTAREKLRRLQDSLRDRGMARESKEYIPPDNVQERILTIYRTSQLVEAKSQVEEDEEQILGLDLYQNKALKFNLLVKCIEEFQHDVPNSQLNELRNIRDIVEYYSTPIRGINPYNALLRKEDSLPVNLALISEPLRFDKESDTFFQGYTAFPGLVSKVPGLRAKKKYPILNQDEFQWPDI